MKNGVAGILIVILATVGLVSFILAGDASNSKEVDTLRVEVREVKTDQKEIQKNQQKLEKDIAVILKTLEFQFNHSYKKAEEKVNNDSTRQDSTEHH